MRFAVVSVLVLSSACGMSPEDSRATWGSVKNAMGGGSGQALSITFDTEVDCEVSGELELAAHLDIGEDATAYAENADVAFGYEIEFRSCRPDENTLDGQLEYAALVSTDVTEDSASAQIVFVYEGTVNVSGEENGTCEVDMRGYVDANAVGGTAGEPGDEFNASVDVVYEGTVCGNDASETLNVSVSSDDEDDLDA
jgi:hypothetical protein